MCQFFLVLRKLADDFSLSQQFLIPGYRGEQIFGQGGFQIQLVAFLGTKQYLPTALLYCLQKSGKICMAGQGHGLFPPLLRYSVGLHPITLRNTAVK